MRKKVRWVLYPSMTRLHLQTPISRFPQPTSKKPQTQKWNNKELRSSFWVATLDAPGYEREWRAQELVRSESEWEGSERVRECWGVRREREIWLRVNEKDTLQGFEMNWVCVFQRNTIKGRGNQPTNPPSLFRQRTEKEENPDIKKNQ